MKTLTILLGAALTMSGCAVGPSTGECTAPPPNAGVHHFREEY